MLCGKADADKLACEVRRRDFVRRAGMPEELLQSGNRPIGQLSQCRPGQADFLRADNESQILPPLPTLLPVEAGRRVLAHGACRFRTCASRVRTDEPEPSPSARCRAERVPRRQGAAGSPGSRESSIALRVPHPPVLRRATSTQTSNSSARVKRAISSICCVTSNREGRPSLAGAAGFLQAKVTPSRKFLAGGAGGVLRTAAHRAT